MTSIREPSIAALRTGAGEGQMKTIDRKAAVAAYKERKTFPGIYAVRCSESGQVWVGRAGDVATIRNRVWFALQHDTCTNSDLQGAWNSHGGNCFIFEELERLDPEALSYVRDRRLQERLAHWRSLLGALAI